MVEEIFRTLSWVAIALPSIALIMGGAIYISYRSGNRRLAMILGVVLVIALIVAAIYVLVSMTAVNEPAVQ